MEEITNNILCCDLCSFSALYVSCAPHTASTLHSLVSANTHSKIVSRKLRHHTSVYLNFLIFRTNHNSNSFINYHLQSVRQKKQILCPNSGASWVAVHPESGPKAEGRMLLQKQAACLQKCVPGLAMPLSAMEWGTALDKQHLPMVLPIFVNWYSSGTDVDKQRCSETSPIGTWELCIDLVNMGHKMQAGGRGPENLCQLW